MPSCCTRKPTYGATASTTLHPYGAQDLVTALTIPRTKLPFLGHIRDLRVRWQKWRCGGGRVPLQQTFVAPSGRCGIGGPPLPEVLHAWHLLTALYIEAGLSLAKWFKQDLPEAVPLPFREFTWCASRP
jgi:hypothetical protein